MLPTRLRDLALVLVLGLSTQLAVGALIEWLQASGFDFTPSWVDVELRVERRSDEAPTLDALGREAVADGRAMRWRVVHDGDGTLHVRLPGPDRPPLVDEAARISALRDHLDTQGYDSRVRGFRSRVSLTAIQVVLLIGPVTLGLVGAIVLYRRHGAELGRSLRPTRRELAVGLGVGLVAVGVNMALVLTLDIDTHPLVEVLVRTPGLVALSIFIAPFTEELLYRGVLFGALHRGHRGLAYGVSALAFGLAHGHLPALPVYLTLAVMFAYAYERTGKLIVPILAHAVVNLAAVALAFLAR